MQPFQNLEQFMFFAAAEVKTIPVSRSSSSHPVATLISVIRWEDDRKTCQAVFDLTELSLWLTIILTDVLSLGEILLT